VMAQRLWTYERILGRYFPGTHVARESREDVIVKAQPVMNPAALPPHSAERLRLSGARLQNGFEAMPPFRGVASTNLVVTVTEGPSPSALCGGRAADVSSKASADLIWKRSVGYVEALKSSPP